MTSFLDDSNSVSAIKTLPKRIRTKLTYDFSYVEPNVKRRGKKCPKRIKVLSLEFHVLPNFSFEDKKEKCFHKYKHVKSIQMMHQLCEAF